MSKEFPDGIRYYTMAKATITVAFPENRVLCQYCPHCRAEQALGRYFCRLTGDILYTPFDGVGENCPLKIKNTKEVKTNDK